MINDHMSGFIQAVGDGHVLLRHPLGAQGRLAAFGAPEVLLLRLQRVVWRAEPPWLAALGAEALGEDRGPGQGLGQGLRPYERPEKRERKSARWGRW